LAPFGQSSRVLVRFLDPPVEGHPQFLFSNPPQEPLVLLRTHCFDHVTCARSKNLQRISPHSIHLDFFLSQTPLFLRNFLFKRAKNPPQVLDHLTQRLFTLFPSASLNVPFSTKPQARCVKGSYLVLCSYNLSGDFPFCSLFLLSLLSSNYSRCLLVGHLTPLAFPSFPFSHPDFCCMEHHSLLLEVATLAFLPLATYPFLSFSPGLRLGLTPSVTIWPRCFSPPQDIFHAFFAIFRNKHPRRFSSPVSLLLPGKANRNFFLSPVPDSPLPSCSTALGGAGWVHFPPFVRPLVIFMFLGAMRFPFQTSPCFFLFSRGTFTTRAYNASPQSSKPPAYLSAFHTFALLFF